MTRKLIIIGSGPAGYTAGVYAARAKLEPLILAGEIHGGQLMNTTVVENWPGAREGILGPELMEAMRQQAQKFGAEILDKNVTEVDFTSKVKEVHTLEVKYAAEAVIITTGASSQLLGIPGEKEFLGRGVATCAVCDAAFYKDKVVVVIGGGDAACEDALTLTKFAEKVYVVVRRDALRASKIMAERVVNHPKIKILWNTQVQQINGDQKVEEIVLIEKPGIRRVKSVNDNQGLRGMHPSEIGKDQRIMKVDGVFLAIGHQPATAMFADKLTLDQKGFMVTEMTGKNSDWLNGFPTMTSVPGVFAAGDVVDHRYKQAITAAGMGCMAALDAEKYLSNSAQ